MDKEKAEKLKDLWNKYLEETFGKEEPTKTVIVINEILVEEIFLKHKLC